MSRMLFKYLKEKSLQKDLPKKLLQIQSSFKIQEQKQLRLPLKLLENISIQKNHIKIEFFV